ESAEPAPLFVRVPDTRRALSSLADAFHGHPSRELCVVGVTGTDGKSTTVWFAYRLLLALGVPAGFISTVALETTGTVTDNPWRQSTPEAPEIHRRLREMADSGKRVAVVEATSHGLSEKTCRLADVRFDVAVFTNLSHEHLEFHGSYEQYRSDKGNLFRALRRAVAEGAATSECGPAAVVNGDDGESDYFAALAREAGVPRVLRYSIGATGADLSAFLAEMSPLSTTIALDGADGVTVWTVWTVWTVPPATGRSRPRVPA
ncbi:MAG: Mur ligase family protein, partial [Spirochaetaceae bacterium]